MKKRFLETFSNVMLGELAETQLKVADFIDDACSYSSKEDKVRCIIEHLAMNFDLWKDLKDEEDVDVTFIMSQYYDWLENIDPSTIEIDKNCSFEEFITKCFAVAYHIAFDCLTRLLPKIEPEFYEITSHMFSVKYVLEILFLILYFYVDSDGSEVDWVYVEKVGKDLIMRNFEPYHYDINFEINVSIE